MRVLIQRVQKASVTIDGKVVGAISKGYLILFGAKEGDSQNQVKLLAEKTVNLRIMADENQKMNKSIMDVAGEILVVSQFTLYADVKGGRRPSFIKAAKPEVANTLYISFVDKLKSLGVKKVATGEFGAYMEVELINDGPVTIILDSDEL